MTAQEQRTILALAQCAQALCPERDVAAILTALGLPRATYDRWGERERNDDWADRIVTPKREAIPPTPEQVETIRDFARHQPLLGYQRLS